MKKKTLINMIANYDHNITIVNALLKVRTHGYYDFDNAAPEISVNI